METTREKSRQDCEKQAERGNDKVMPLALVERNKQCETHSICQIRVCELRWPGSGFKKKQKKKGFQIEMRRWGD